MERKSNYSIDELFLKRISTRAMSPEKIPDEDLMALFEAARWAPSSFNNQPWRFLYTTKENENWKTFFNLMFDANKVWAKNAYALVVVLSRKKMEYKDRDNPTHSFDTGAAWMSLTLEATKRDLIAHGIAGFDFDKAKKVLNIPNIFNVEAMIVIAKKGDLHNLPDELQKKEIISDRKDLSEIAYEGKFKK